MSQWWIDILNRGVHTCYYCEKTKKMDEFDHSLYRCNDCYPAWENGTEKPKDDK